MLIVGTIEYNNNGNISEEKLRIDTANSDSSVSKDVYDAVAFALYGKTVFEEIVRPEKGVPMIALQITCNGKSVRIVRQPHYVREAALGSAYLTEELFSLATEEMQYDSLSAEKYYEMIKDYIDMSYEDFAKYCK